MAPGLYAFRRNTADAKVVEIDTRETTLDVGGQEIMAADKVMLRLNALAAYRVIHLLTAQLASQGDASCAMASQSRDFQ